jgi:hypothetical protein
MEIGAANAAEGNPNLHLPGAGFHGHAFAHTERPIAFKKYGLHD